MQPSAARGQVGRDPARRDAAFGQQSRAPPPPTPAASVAQFPPDVALWPQENGFAGDIFGPVDS
eukprot:11199374-Lingulodinium_polyedra.AAC.1